MILVSGLAYRQLVERSRYLVKEEIQSQRRIIHPAPRGNIFDRNGELLVGNQGRFSAVLYLNELRSDFRLEYISIIRALREIEERTGERSHLRGPDLQWAARIAVVQNHLDKVNNIIGREGTINERSFRNHFLTELVMPFTIVNDLSPNEYALLQEQLPTSSPVQIRNEIVRYYPHGQLAAHTLGYVVADFNLESDNLPGEDLMTFAFRGRRGRTGLEYSFNHLLEGREGGEVWLVDPLGFQYERIQQVIPESGTDLTTSIELNLQLAAERALEGYTGAVVAIEVNTGEVLAIASSPTYDLNDFSPFISRQVWATVTEEGGLLNRATQGLYPPGSTFKLMTAIAGLRTGDLARDEIIYSPSGFLVGNRVFPEHGRRSFGNIDLPQALAVSSNVFFYQVGLRVGIRTLAREMRRFGLHEPTGIEIPNESRHTVVPDPDWKRGRGLGGWVPGDTANVSIGQGFLLFTPLQMAAFTASLARGETLTNVTLLHDPTRQFVTPQHRGEPIDLSPADYSAILEGMERAVTSGTARAARLADIDVAAKTGTAQIRARSQPLTLAWTVAFAPIDEPQIAIAVMIEGMDPRDGFAGGSTAAPVVREVLQTFFNN